MNERDSRQARLLAIAFMFCCIIGAVLLIRWSLVTSPNIAKGEAESAGPPKTELVPNIPPDKSKAQNRPQAGDILRVRPGNLPGPFQGTPAPKSIAGWKRIAQLAEATDAMGLLKESDGVNCFFVRAQTKVRVIDPNYSVISDEERVMEVRMVDGAFANESGLMLESTLGRDPKPPSDLPNSTNLNEGTRREIFNSYFSNLDASFDEAAKSLSTNGPDAIKLALRTRRTDFETKAVELKFPRDEELQSKHKLSKNEVEAVIWDGLRRGWEVKFRDY